MPVLDRFTARHYQILFWLALFAISTAALTEPSTIDLPHIDKLIHSISFLVLSFLFHYGFPSTQLPFFKSSLRPPIQRALILFCYGASIELIQSQLSWREGSILDMIANGSGIIIYIWFSDKLQLVIPLPKLDNSRL